jgi:hypothetical protein
MSGPTHTQHTLAEASKLSGIPVEEIHNRVWRGDLPGIAAPGSRQVGTISGETLERLIAEQQQARQESRVAVPDTHRAKSWGYQAVPVAYAAGELGVTVAEVERLIAAGEIEGMTYNYPRWVTVRVESLEAYRQRRESVPAPVVPVVEAPPAPVPPPAMETLPDARFRILPSWVTEAFRS